MSKQDDRRSSAYRTCEEVYAKLGGDGLRLLPDATIYDARESFEYLRADMAGVDGALLAEYYRRYWAARGGPPLMRSRR